MLRHAIAPVRRYTKASHDIVRHPRLNSDAKVLILYVQGLPEGEAARPLNEHATKMGMKPRAYHRAKEALVACGFFFEWRWQNGRGRWTTDQLMANVSLTREEADRVRDGVPPPSPPEPTVGPPGPRVVGGSPPEDKNGEKNIPHPPPEAPPEAPAVPGIPGATEPSAVPEAPGAAGGPEVAEAERLLLSLRHTHRDLLLGVREARGLADAAAEWLRRGVPAADLRQALTSGLPPGGVRSAVGFLRHRLTEKLPVPAGPPTRAGLIACAGPGDDHVFRPVGDETLCAPCRRRAAARASGGPPPRRPVSWRQLLQEGVGPV
ncbi:hypothetical protein [Streptomyces sp. NPDC050856]|uniref:hypothetical protein n=1 Tax=Streptomyces sp. NPDC050856 TaxID=3154939 RepID=UPI0033D95E48